MGAGNLVSEDGLLNSIHDKPNIVMNTFDFCVGFVGSNVVGGLVVVIINKRLYKSCSSFSVVTDCNMGNFHLMYFPESSGSSPSGKTQVDVVSETKSHDVGRKIPESKVDSTLRQRGQIHLEEVDGEFPVDIVEFELMLILLVFSPIFRG